MLDTIIEAGLDLTLVVQHQAKIEVETAARLNEPAPDFTFAFERMARTVRRTILLSDRLGQPAQAPAAAPVRDPVAVRKQIIRTVEDSIARDAAADQAESLHAEFLDRLDSPELAHDIQTRPVADIIVEIRRDLGIAGQAGNRPWKRRTPQDVALLCARAATKLPATGPFVLPMPPRGWTYDNPLFPAPGAAQMEGEAGIRGP